MLPTIWPGDTLGVERANRDDLSEGDIVLFSRERRILAHRMVRRSSDGEGTILTRGDAMPQSDPPVSDRDLLGKVAFILRNGECIEPRRRLRFSERAVAAACQWSKLAARAVVGVHCLRQPSQSTSQVQAALLQEQ